MGGDNNMVERLALAVAVMDDDAMSGPLDRRDGAAEPDAVPERGLEPLDRVLTAAHDRAPDWPVVAQQAMVVEEGD